MSFDLAPNNKSLDGFKINNMGWWTVLDTTGNYFESGHTIRYNSGGEIIEEEAKVIARCLLNACDDYRFDKEEADFFRTLVKWLNASGGFECY